MNIDLILLFIFGLILILIIYKKRKNVQLEKLLFPFIYLLLYRTKFGLKRMDSFAKRHPKFLKIFGNIAIYFGFLGMALIIFFFILQIKLAWQKPEYSITLFLPGMKLPGLPYLTFWYWIIAIFVLAIVHEFSHGIVARLHKIKIKSSGFGILALLLPIIPAAFVEPDEKQLQKKNIKAQLNVLSAGSFSNLIMAFVIGLIYFLLVIPYATSMVNYQGVMVNGLMKDYPLEKSGIKVGEEILSINNIQIHNISEFKEIMEKTKPNQEILIKTNVSEYKVITVEHPNNKSVGYIGIFSSSLKEEKKEKVNSAWFKFFKWFQFLVFWIYYANLLVGLINLLPLGIFDGGRMFYLAILFFTRKNKKLSKKILIVVSILIILLLFINILPRIINWFSSFAKFL